MDLNIAALIRQDTKTVTVAFQQNGQRISRPPYSADKLGAENYLDQKTSAYTYVTDLDLVPGDFVVVYATEHLKVGQVVLVDKECKIAPNDTTQYKWVVDKIDMAKYTENRLRNDKIEELVSKSYKSRLRQQFADMTLACLPDEERGELQNLIGGK